MKKLLKKIMKRFSRVETRNVYCITSNTEQEARDVFFFGIHIGTTYTEITETPLGI